MSHLRQQLQSARDDYRTARYPGDLAADVLRRGRGRLWLAIAVGGAIAAAVALAVWLHGLRTVAPIPEPDQVAVQSAEPIWPADVQWVPHDIELTFPPVPSFPSWDALSEMNTAPETDSSASTKESV